MDEIYSTREPTTIFFSLSALRRCRRYVKKKNFFNFILFFRFLKNVARAEKTRRLNEKEEPARHKNAVSTASRLPINAN